jgi:DNA-binding SARP family transcriptional activator
MEIRILGPVEVLDDDGTVAIASRLQRGLLARLALDVGRAVPTTRILDDLWGDEPPEGGARTVAFHIVRLRNALAPSRPHGDMGPITTEPAGYALRVDPGSVDAVRFEQGVRAARSLVPAEPARAVELLEAALGLWRGDALEGLGEQPFVAAAARRLHELRDSAVEDRVEAQLALGEAAALVPELRGLVAEEPLRERRHAQLMLALYRSGRQADALEAYRAARSSLRDELGLDPGPELESLERAILRQDPALLAGHAAAAGRRNPYKGLRPFAEADAGDFFGRESLVARLHERLGEVARGGHCLLVVGPSGSGKSSVLRAGLLPCLRPERAIPPEGADGSTWWIFDLSPGNHPVEELAAVLRTGGPISAPPPDAGALSRDHTALARYLRGRPPSAGRPLILVDQLEELYADAVPSDERAAFVGSIVAALDDPGARLVLVAAIRADVLDRPLADPTLGPRVATAIVPVTPIEPAELERAVTGPAEGVGAALEPGLVDRILADVHARPNALPLLQFALTALYERSDGRTLTRRDYDAVGGVSGALAGAAERTYLDLADADRRTARRLFLHLIALDRDRAPRSRAVQRAGLDALDPLAARVERVLEAFVRARLLTLARDPDQGTATVEVAHDALLARWPRLATWIADEREALWTQARLAVAAADWVEEGREKAGLLRGTRLELMRSWASTTDLSLSAQQREYLDASVAASDREAQAETDRLARERRLEQRSSRILRALVAVLAIAVVVSTSLLALVWRQGQGAGEDRAIATARELAVASAGQLPSDPVVALLLAVESARATADRGWISEEAMDALHWALQAARVPYPPGDLPTAVRNGPSGARGIEVEEPGRLVLAAMTAAGRPLDAAECALYLHGAPCPPSDGAWAGGRLAVRGPSGVVRPVGAYASGSLAGTKVRIASQAPVDLATLLGDLTAASGITTEAFVPATLDDAAAADIAILSRPDDLSTLARERQLLDLRTFVVPSTERAAVGDMLAGVGVGSALAASGDASALYGVPIAFSIGDLLWYPRDALRTAGHAPPSTWTELTALVDAIESEGGTPWCLGLQDRAGAEDAAGWLEDLVLGSSPRQTYEWWAQDHFVYGPVEFGEELRRLRQLLATDAVHTGLEGAGLIPHAVAGFAMFDPTGPACWIQHADSTFRMAFPSALRGELGVVPVPPRDPSMGPALRIHAFTVALLQDRPETRAAVIYLLGSAFASRLAASTLETGVLPARAVERSTVADPIDRVLIERYGDRLVLDATDRMAAPLASAVPDAVARYLLQGGGSTDQELLDSILTHLEDIRDEVAR